MNKKVLEKAVVKAAEFTVKTNVNSSCWFMFHQAVIPESGMKKFKKNN